MTNLQEDIRKMYLMRPKQFDEMMAHMRSYRLKQKLLADTNDETLRNVFKQVGFMEALDDLRHWFKGV